MLQRLMLLFETIEIVKIHQFLINSLNYTL